MIGPPTHESFNVQTQVIPQSYSDRTRPYVKKAVRKRFLLLSSSLLVDRVLLYTELVPSLSRCGEVIIWAGSASDDNYSTVWNSLDAEVEHLPAVEPFRAFPYTYLRRLNEYAWDYRLQPPSRLSIRQHIRDKRQPFWIKALKQPGRLLAAIGSEQWFEDKLEEILLAAPTRSLEGLDRIRSCNPTVLLSTGLFQFEQPALYEAARKAGVPTIAYIPSWDNISTKNRMVYKYDGYIVWSDQIREELHHFYPSSKNAPVYVVGAPQFDIFFRDRFDQSREEFCASQGLDPDLPFILYALGSPNFLREHHGAIQFAERVVRGDLGSVQLLIRPHPIHDNAEMRSVFERFGPRVRLQSSPNAGIDLVRRSQDEQQTLEWINTFRHAAVVINLSSTVTIDAAIFDKPIVNLDFDPDPASLDQQLIRDINHTWNHFKPIAESGGVWCVNNYDEMVDAVKGYMANPSLHRDGRKWIAEYVCGRLDGKCGERMAAAINEFAEDWLSRKQMIGASGVSSPRC